MDRSVKLTYALMVGAFLLACVSGYLLFTQARSLTTVRDQLEEKTAERDKAGADLERIRGQADDIRSRMNRARAGTIYLVDSMAASQDFLADQSDHVKQLCDRTTAPGREGDGRNIGSRSDEPDFIKFCSAFSERADWRFAANAVAIDRAAAASPADYGKVAAAYEQLVPKARGKPRETARMYEGLAYSRLRQGRVDEAVSAIAVAQRTDPQLALPAMTSLKIECTRRTDPGQVRASLEALRARLEANLTRIRGILLRYGPNPPADRDLSYAKVERQMVEQDPELYELCSYAGLTPQT